MSPSGLPFDDIRALAAMLPPADAGAMAAVRARNARLAKRPGSLGRLEQIAEWLAGWQGREVPAVTRPLTALFAGAHGVAADGVSSRPPGETAARMATAAAGGAAVNQICASVDCGLKVFELALQVPSGNVVREAALDERDCAATVAFGMEAVSGGTDLLCLGDIGVGSKTVAAAILTALFGGAPEDWLAGDAAGRSAKADAVRRALAVHRDGLADPLEVLRRLGGRDVAALVGALLAARIQRIPVVLDGIVTRAAAAVLYRLDAGAIDHCMAAHDTGEPAQRKALADLKLTPLMALGITLGEGAGAALSVSLIRAAAACHAEMALADDPAGTLN